MQRVLLHLPVPRYLKKILEFKYGENYVPRENSLLGFTILNSLQKKSDRKYQYKKASDHNDHFFLYIGIDKISRKGIGFNEKKAYQIAKALDRNIREELYLEAYRNKISYGIDIQVTLLNFLDLYDITEEELSYETLRKDFNRYDFKAKKSGLLSKISQNLNV